MTLANIKNVGRLAAVVEKCMERPAYAQRMGIFNGWSGYGKSTAAAYCAQQYGCFWVQAQETWSMKTMLAAMWRAIHGGVAPKRMNVDELREEVAFALGERRRPLLLDEADLIHRQNSAGKFPLLEVVRLVHMGANNTPIILIGEEGLAAKLEAPGLERVDGRIGVRGQADPLDLEDAELLAKLYTPKLEIEPALLADLTAAVKGSARRITNALYELADFAAAEGVGRVTAADWGARPWVGSKATSRPIGVASAAGAL